MLASALISFAYFLDKSPSYKRTKNAIYDILENDKTRVKVYFDFFMIFLVLVTVTLLIYSIAHELAWYYELIENIAVGIFIIEWLGRFWISADLHKMIINYHLKMIEQKRSTSALEILWLIIKQKIQFIFSPMSIIDLLAILPTYRPLRILRIFLIFRLFKIFRYTKSLNSFFRVFIEKKSEFNILIILSLFFIFMGSTVIYVFEGIGNNPKIESYYDAIYWAIITMSTVGYGDITPVTLIGKIITVFLVGGGFLLIVFATSVVTNALSEKLGALREEKVLLDVSKFSNLIVIIGFGRMGEILAEELEKSHKKFIILDKSDASTLKAKEHKYRYLQADASDYDVLNTVIFQNKVDKVVLTTDDDALNLSVLLTIKAHTDNITVIVRANSQENIRKFHIAKADHVIFPYETVANIAVEYIGNSVKFDAIDNILFQKSSITLDEIIVFEGSDFVGKTIEQTNVLKNCITIIAIVDARDKFCFNPDPQEYILQVNDSIVVIGESASIQNVHVEIARQIA